jgi:hypothetical protein
MIRKRFFEESVGANILTFFSQREECFVDSRAYLGLPLKPVAKNCQIIGISFYRNIVHKNVVCDEVLSQTLSTNDVCIVFEVNYFDFNLQTKLF